MISVTPLGAGQEVGRSCMVLRISHRTFLLDVGMHPAYLDDNRFPDFSCMGVSPSSGIDCVLVSHFHLDHVGALLHLTDTFGYSGPIYMSHPTKALCPSLLEDYNKVVTEQQAGGISKSQVQQSIANAMKGVIGIGCRQRVCPFEDTAITAYYAGHVLGAVMFHIEVGSLSVFYTGDFNTQSQHHLGVADVPYLRVNASCPPLPSRLLTLPVQPSVTICESTFGSHLHDEHQDMAIEAAALAAIHECVTSGGKVLIPVFAVGRAQEIMYIRCNPIQLLFAFLLGLHLHRHPVQVRYQSLLFTMQHQRADISCWTDD